MKPIKFKRTCNYNGKEYKKDDILTDFTDFSSLWKLNENGYIYPMSEKEFVKMYKESQKSKIKLNVTEED